jgi:hypothetical protein
MLLAPTLASNLFGPKAPFNNVPSAAEVLHACIEKKNGTRTAAVA